MPHCHSTLCLTEALDHWDKIRVACVWERERERKMTCKDRRQRDRDEFWTSSHTENASYCFHGFILDHFHTSLQQKYSVHQFSTTAELSCWKTPKFFKRGWGLVDRWVRQNRYNRMVIGLWSPTSALLQLFAPCDNLELQNIMANVFDYMTKSLPLGTVFEYFPIILKLATWEVLELKHIQYIYIFIYMQINKTKSHLHLRRPVKYI